MLAQQIFKGLVAFTNYKCLPSNPAPLLSYLPAKHPSQTVFSKDKKKWSLNGGDHLIEIEMHGKCHCWDRAKWALNTGGHKSRS